MFRTVLGSGRRAPARALPGEVGKVPGAAVFGAAARAVGTSSQVFKVANGVYSGGAPTGRDHAYID